MAVIEIQEIDRISIERFLMGLEDFEKDREIRKSLLKATAWVNSTGRRNLRRWMATHGHPNGVKGNLLSAFRRRVKKKKLGALAGFDTKKGAHVWLVNDGTVERHNGHRRTGVMPASHFWDDTKKQTEGKIGNLLIDSIERSMMRITERRYR